MKYEEFDKLIEDQNREKKQARLKRIKEGLLYPAESMNAESRSVAAEIQCGSSAESMSAAPAGKTVAGKPASKRRNFFKQPARLAACISMAVAVACLAIILPFVLNRSDLPAITPPDNPSLSEERYYAAAACKKIELKYSLKEYSDRNNLSLLYVDWYDVADIKTSLYVNKEDSTDIIYYEEILKHRYAEKSIVEFYITNNRTSTYELEQCKKLCRNQYVPKLPYAQVHWGVEPVEDGEPFTYMAYFNHRNYRYLLVLRYPATENSIFELIDSVLSVRFNATSNKRT